MSAFDDNSVALKGFSGKARLFPLPNLVLFPHVMQPLHVFEPRYRELIEDALAGDGLIAMAGLTPGWEKNYEGRPNLYSMACLGRITTHYRLADGTYNVLLLGLQRVKLIHETKPMHLFREAHVELCSDLYPPYPADRQQALQQKLRDALMEVLPALPEAQEQLDQLLSHDVALGMLTDVIGYMLDIGLLQKQSLLAELDVYRRTNLLLTYLSEATAAQTSDQSVVSFPPAFSVN